MNLQSNILSYGMKMSAFAHALALLVLFNYFEIVFQLIVIFCFL